MSNNIYVGNLPWSFKDDTLRELFEEHGEVADAKVIVDRMSGRSRGFGFVEMTSSDDAASSIIISDFSILTSYNDDGLEDMFFSYRAGNPNFFLR